VGLAPPLDERADYYRWLFFAAGPVEAAVMNRHLGFEVSSEQERMVGYGHFQHVLDALELAVAGAEYIAGARFSAADVYVGSQIGWGLQFGTLEERPGFAAYWARVSDRDAYRRANALDDALLAAG
jgi:glutathione S-transferase